MKGMTERSRPGARARRNSPLHYRSVREFAGQRSPVGGISVSSRVGAFGCLVIHALCSTRVLGVVWHDASCRLSPIATTGKAPCGWLR